MESVTLKAEKRPKVGTNHARSLRSAGRLPGIIYGHGQDPQAVALDNHDFGVALAHNVRTLVLDIDGDKQQYLIKEIQYDHLGSTPVHVDLTRVRLDERVQVVVGIELRGTPKGVDDGGVLEQRLASIEVECLVTNIPDTLEPFIADLGLNDSLLVKDLELPEGVVPLEEPDAVICSVKPLVEEEEVAEEAEEGEEGAEPERIGRVRADEDEEKGEEK